MATPKVSISSSYTPKAGDFVCLPFCDGKKPCYPKALTPKLDAAGPEDRGGSRLVLAGASAAALTGDKAAHLCAKIYRMDKRYTSPARVAKMMVADGLSSAADQGAKRVVVLADGGNETLVRAAQEGALLGGYAFDTYKAEKAKPLPVLIVAPKLSTVAKKRLGEEAAVCERVNAARDVLNEPSNVIDPVTLAKRFQALAKGTGLKVTVWDEKRLAKEKCGGILGVGQGSAVPPRLLWGEYKPRGAKFHLGLVGKGVTFDTGGYCLKPSAAQVGMKLDMGGAAAVFPAACAIAALKLPIRVTVLTPLVRNDISATAYHTTDILTTRAGRTVQVDSTDAEGRLILSDALTLAQEKKPDLLIDAATLTGACMVALGEDIAGAYATDRIAIRGFMEAAAEAGEYFWELPLHMPYMEQLKTTLADCKNIGGKYGGSVTAALFLKQWIDDDQPWIHLDIAGPGIKEEPIEHLGKGAKGFGVKTLVALARSLA